jgi:hypothetical protein
MTTKRETIWDEYKVKLTLLRPMLGTNPSDPDILGTHILERQRKIIAEKSPINKELNKYYNQIQISPERGEQDSAKLIDKLEELIGATLTPDQRELAAVGKIDELRETFAELDNKGTTVFFWDKELNRPCIGDHMIPGFLKAATEAICKTRARKNGTVLGSISYTCSLINQHLSVKERYIPFDKDIMRDKDGFAKGLQRPLRAMTAQGPRVTLASSEMVDAGATLEFTLQVLKDSDITEDVLHTLFQYGQSHGLGQWRNAGWGKFEYELSPLHAVVGLPHSKQKAVEAQPTMQ